MQLITTIDVDDLEAAVAFYTGGLGFNECRRLFDGSVAELSFSGTLVYLQAKPPGTQPYPQSSAERSYARHWTPVHLDVVVDNIESAVARAVDAGAKLERPIRSEGTWQEAQLSDPFGHGFCLLENWPP